MNITAKSRYALKIMMDLAAVPEGLTQRHDIAARQGIPLDFMDHVLCRLREAGLIASARGRAGGYRLARPADGISVLEIFTTVEDAFQPVQCLDGGQGCVVEHVCSSRDAWSEISQAISGSLSGIILADLVAHRKPAGVPSASSTAATGSARQSVQAVQECRAPRRRAGAEAR
jgi:Rrf2 family protein